MRSGRGSSSSVHLADVGRRRGQKWALTLGTECGARGSCSGAAAGLRASGTRGLPHVVPFFNVQDSGMGGQPADGEGKVGSVEVPASKQDARSHEDAQAVQHAAVMWCRRALHAACSRQRSCGHGRGQQEERGRAQGRTGSTYHKSQLSAGSTAQSREMWPLPSTERVLVGARACWSALETRWRLLTRR